MTDRRPAPVRVRVTGDDTEHVNRATDVIRSALLASGYTDQPPARHLRACAEPQGRFGMRAGTPDLWEMADAFGVAPAPPDERLARLLADWWTVPRMFGCVTAARDSSWAVVAPDLRVLVQRVRRGAARH